MGRSASMGLASGGCHCGAQSSQASLVHSYIYPVPAGCQAWGCLGTGETIPRRAATVPAFTDGAHDQDLVHMLVNVILGMTREKNSEMPERQPPGDPGLGGRAREASLEVPTFEQSPVKRVRVWEANWVPSRGSWARRSELPHPQREVLEDGGLADSPPRGLGWGWA